jgi:hypothetical protein
MCRICANITETTVVEFGRRNIIALICEIILSNDHLNHIYYGVEKKRRVLPSLN